MTLNVTRGIQPGVVIVGEKNTLLTNAQLEMQNTIYVSIKKIGHYGAFCRSRDIYTLTQESDNSSLENKKVELEEDQFLRVINSHSQTHWTDIFQLNGYYPVQIRHGGRINSSV